MVGKRVGESEMQVTALVAAGGETTGRSEQEIAAEVQNRTSRAVRAVINTGVRAVLQTGPGSAEPTG